MGRMRRVLSRWGVRIFFSSSPGVEFGLERMSVRTSSCMVRRLVCLVSLQKRQAGVLLVRKTKWYDRYGFSFSFAYLFTEGSLRPRLLLRDRDVTALRFRGKVVSCINLSDVSATLYLKHSAYNMLSLCYDATDSGGHTRIIRCI